jgi:phosphoglycolate phosphatase
VKYDSVGFDLDGTLWNSLDTITKAWDKAASEYGVSLPSYDDMRSVMGMNRTDLMTKLFPEFSDEKKNEFFERSSVICDELLSKYGGQLYDGLEDTLSELSKHVKLYIVSNCQNGYIETFLKFHKLRKYFCDFRCSGKKCTPKGENIKDLIICNRFKNSIFVGDTQGDKDAADLAGVPFIFASYGFGYVDSYDFKVKSFSEIKGLIL